MNTLKNYTLLTISFCMLLFSCSSDDSDNETPPPTPCPKNTLCDTRDNQQYKTVTIGNQTWMAENLNLNTNTADSTSYRCYDDQMANCETDGGLYAWNVAKVACPEGWRLPSRTDFRKLLDELGGEDEAVDKLLVGGSSGFDAIITGVWDEEFINRGTETNFWSSDEADNRDAIKLGFSTNTTNRVFINDTQKTQGFCIRCLKNN